MNEVFKTVIAGYEIIMSKDKRKDLFTVQYGSDTRSKLNYTKAAHELVECIMHALACECVIEYNQR